MFSEGIDGPTWSSAKQVRVVNNSDEVLDVAVFLRQHRGGFLRSGNDWRSVRVSPVVRIPAHAPTNVDVVPYIADRPSWRDDLYLYWTSLAPGGAAPTGCWTEMVTSPSSPLPPTENFAKLSSLPGVGMQTVTIGAADRGCCPGYSRAAKLEGTATLGMCSTRFRAAPTLPRRPVVGPPPPPRPVFLRPTSLPPPPPPPLSPMSADEQIRAAQVAELVRPKPLPVAGHAYALAGAADRYPRPPPRYAQQHLPLRAEYYSTCRPTRYLRYAYV